MSKLQSSAKPILTEMLKENFTDLKSEDQKIVSSWLASFVMVSEYTEPDAVAIGQEVRNEFRKSQQVPPNWIIWLGRYAGGDMGNSFYFGSSLGLKKSPVSPNIHAVDFDTKISTIIVGDLLFQVFSSDNPALNIFISSRYIPLLGMKPFWPIQTDSFRMPVGKIDDAGMRWLFVNPKGLVSDFLVSLAHL
jgi:hypothetical protein